MGEGARWGRGEEVVVPAHALPRGVQIRPVLQARTLPGAVMCVGGARRMCIVVSRGV
jgi:hypothetical protein